MRLFTSLVRVADEIPWLPTIAADPIWTVPQPAIPASAASTAAVTVIEVRSTTDPFSRVRPGRGWPVRSGRGLPGLPEHLCDQLRAPGEQPGITEQRRARRNRS